MSTAAPVLAVRPPRLLSLDVLRGLTIAFMILVNNNADERIAYWPLKHADWNGFTPTDLVFPTFLFLVGISTVLSTASRLAQGATRQSLLLHALRRAVTLFLLGLLVNSFPYFHLATMRFYGVLPRIAICYLVAATLYIASPGWRSKAALAVSLLAAYWILLRLVPVPGYGVPTHAIPLLDRDANLTAWLDRRVFSAGHLYERTRDPEGLLSTLPALATTLLGMLTGIWLRTTRPLVRKVQGIAVAGATCVLLGGIWNLTFPINKKLWTSSYVLFAGGLSLLLLALCFWLVDLPKKDGAGAGTTKPRGLMPFLVFGTNAITAYVFSELIGPALTLIPTGSSHNIVQLFYRLLLRFIPSQPFASLCFSLAFVALTWLFVYVLYRRRIFLKI